MFFCLHQLQCQHQSIHMPQLQSQIQHQCIHMPQLLNQYQLQCQSIHMLQLLNQYQLHCQLQYQLQCLELVHQLFQDCNVDMKKVNAGPQVFQTWIVLTVPYVVLMVVLMCVSLLKSKVRIYILSITLCQLHKFNMYPFFKSIQSLSYVKH